MLIMMVEVVIYVNKFVLSVSLAKINTVSELWGALKRSYGHSNQHKEGLVKLYKVGKFLR